MLYWSKILWMVLWPGNSQNFTTVHSAYPKLHGETLSIWWVKNLQRQKIGKLHVIFTIVFSINIWSLFLHNWSCTSGVFMGLQASLVGDSLVGNTTDDYPVRCYFLCIMQPSFALKLNLARFPYFATFASGGDPPPALFKLMGVDLSEKQCGFDSSRAVCSGRFVAIGGAFLH